MTKKVRDGAKKVRLHLQDLPYLPQIHLLLKEIVSKEILRKMIIKEVHDQHQQKGLTTKAIIFKRKISKGIIQEDHDLQ